MTIYQPYTYLIRFKPTLELYYGSKTAKGCHPDQFWIKYFTTSKIVKKLIEEYGVDSFEVIYTKNHATKEAALKWETMYLVSVNAALNENYLNRHNGGENFCVTKESILKNTGENHWNYGGHQSDELNKAHSERMSGEKHPQFGIKQSEEWKQKNREGHLGKRVTAETLIKMSIATTGENNPNYGNTGELSSISKTYVITFPDLHEEVITGLREFCRNHNLDHSTLVKIAKNKPSYIQHKGYKCRYAD